MCVDTTLSAAASMLWGHGASACPVGTKVAPTNLNRKGSAFSKATRIRELIHDGPIDTPVGHDR